jgi:hypothetical protein
MYLVEFNVAGPGEPRTVEIKKAASYADAVGQALSRVGGVARTLLYVKAGAHAADWDGTMVGPFDHGMEPGHEMAIMDIRCFKVED